MRTARRVAFQDISNYLIELNGGKPLANVDRFTVTPNIMHENSREITKLNRELGIHKLNVQNNGDRLPRFFKK
jgi:hypothetical protein